MLGMFYLGPSVLQMPAVMELVVKESSLWRLLFLITFQQIRFSFWVGREAVWFVLCRTIGPKGNLEVRLDLRPCPSCRERKRVRNRVKQSKPCDLYAFHLCCQLQFSNSPEACACFGEQDPRAVSDPPAGFGSIMPSFSPEAVTAKASGKRVKYV